MIRLETMANKSSSNADLGEWFSTLGRQFSGLDPNDPSRWPAAPKALLFTFIFALVMGAAWYIWFDDQSIELEAEKTKEVQLRETYRDKLSQAVTLEELKKQLEQVRQYVVQLEKQLPSKAEMAALLSDINQAGLGRSLQFEVFKPGQVNVKEYYAELPISIKLSGGYHDIGLFASDVAHLARIVTLNDLSIGFKDKSTQLVLEGVAKTYRYLDMEEVAQQQKMKKAKETGK